jgi:hypothetical protein
MNGKYQFLVYGDHISTMDESINTINTNIGTLLEAREP